MHRCTSNSWLATLPWSEARNRQKALVTLRNADYQVNAVAFADPIITIDPSYPYKDEVRLDFSANLLSAPSDVPETESMLLVGTALLCEHNRNLKPFVGAATAEEILGKIKRFCERTHETRRSHTARKFPTLVCLTLQAEGILLFVGVCMDGHVSY